MSERIDTHDNRATIRWKLLTGASALALTAYVSSSAMARAEDGGRPQVWIELDGQLARLQDKQEIYAPPFVARTPPDFAPPQKAERPPLYGLNESAALTFQPKDSDWMFSASIRYGRASSGRLVHHQTYPGMLSYYARVISGTVENMNVFPTPPINARFTDARVKQSESQTVIDFHAGKDVGLGLFGRSALSSLEVGVRFAQFTSKSQIGLVEDPDWHVVTSVKTFYFPPNPKRGKPAKTTFRQYIHQPFHSYAGNFEAHRSFRGVGPSLSWQASLPFAGNEQSSELAIDWGLNAALLFGRQRTRTSHQTSGRFGPGERLHPADISVTYSHPAIPHTRSRNVTVPNAGGFAALSYNYANARISLGYRADFFFNAIDGGIDKAKKEDRGFYGPYASISIGLGD